MNVRLTEEVAQRDKQEFQYQLYFLAEQALSELINFEATHLQKLERMKYELNYSDLNCNPLNYFKAIDMQALGFIDQEVLKNFMIKNGFVLTDNQLYFIIRRINKNKTGRVTLEEFSKFLATQHINQYERNIEEARSKSFNLSNNYFDQEYTNFYLQRYGNISNNKTDTSLNLPRSQLRQSSEILSKSHLNEESQVDELNFSKDNVAKQILKKQDEDKISKSLNLINKEQTQNYLIHSDQNIKITEMKMSDLNQKVDKGDQQNANSQMSCAKENNNIFKKECQNSFSSQKFMQSMINSIKKSFYKPLKASTANEFLKNSDLLNQNFSFDLTNPISNLKFQINETDPANKQFFSNFLLDLIEISKQDKLIEKAKLEFIGLINCSISNLFDFISHKRRDTIVFSEFNNFITNQMGFKSLTSQDNYIIFQYFDVNHQGFITKENLILKFNPQNPFLLNYKPYLPIQETTEAEKMKLEQFFQSIVKNVNSVNKLKLKYSSANNQNFDSLSLNELFNLLDYDNDSYISVYDVSIGIIYHIY